MIDHNHFICHFILGGHLLNIPSKRSCALHIKYTCIFEGSELTFKGYSTINFKWVSPVLAFSHFTIFSLLFWSGTR